MTSTTDAPTTRATHAVYAAFLGLGLAFATWASRIPQVRDDLDLSPASLGLLLMCLSVGALVALPTSGMVVHRLGARRTLLVTSLLFCAGLALAGLGTRVSVAAVAPGLVLAGYGFSTWDVAANVEGAEVEHRLGWSIMPRFHALYAVGAVAGALIGVGMNALGVSVAVHFVLAAALLAVAMVATARQFLPAGDVDEQHAEGRAHPLRAWLEPRTLLIGLFVLCMAFAEGTGGDWLGIAAIDGYGVSAALASVVYGVFMVGMLLSRWYGHVPLDRFGRVAALRVSAAATALGVLVVVFAPTFPLVLAGSLLWGLGAGLGFPVGMSAAADDPRQSAGRVSVVATVGYLAFLLGPASVGFLGEHTGVLHALTITSALMGVAFLTAAATRPLGGGRLGR